MGLNAVASVLLCEDACLCARVGFSFVFRGF